MRNHGERFSRQSDTTRFASECSRRYIALSRRTTETAQGEEAQAQEGQRKEQRRCETRDGMDKEGEREEKSVASIRAHGMGPSLDAPAICMERKGDVSAGPV